MSRIRIKNFGPIKGGYQENDGWIDINKVTVLIGNQGSGKSTIAKLFSTLSWIEKALVRGDYNSKWFTQRKRFQNVYCKYHRLENYFSDSNSDYQTEIEYQGEAYHIAYKAGNLTVNENKTGKYLLPQIMYVPAERNFISTVRKPDVLKFSSESLVEFVTEFDNAKNQMRGNLSLPINNVDIEYDKLNDIINIKGEGYKIRLTESSSGYQSLVPLYLVSRYLANRIESRTRGGTYDKEESMSSFELKRFSEAITNLFQDAKLTDEQKRVALSAISKRFNKRCFINIVEEPEQNLFPTSQQKILNSLLEFNNMDEANKLIMTTHSPYLINYLTLSVKANMLAEMIKTEKNLKLLNEIVPLLSTVKPIDLIIYELDEKEGSIKKLEAYNGLPSDENELNERLGDGNELFAQLLEIQQNL
ncbi:AAA family ATPase [Runella sp.]|uniref:AAA family ATPase n=1 Tax=Runella sp. TaxID=1960881 RepID=UPI0026178178|nr:AAA family ATPase [Runella sp.]